ncbi:MAG: hypothetical protein ABIS38_03780 [Sphingomicrobium sp.]
MIDRRLLRDAILAVCLAIPTVALARPQSTPLDHAPSVQPLAAHAAMADRTGAERRFALPN